MHLALWQMYTCGLGLTGPKHPESHATRPSSTSIVTRHTIVYFNSSHSARAKRRQSPHFETRFPQQTFERHRFTQHIPTVNIAFMASAARRAFTSSWGARRVFAQCRPRISSSRFAGQRSWEHQRIPSSNLFQSRSYHGAYSGASGQSW